MISSHPCMRDTPVHSQIFAPTASETTRNNWICNAQSEARQPTHTTPAGSERYSPRASRSFLSSLNLLKRITSVLEARVDWKSNTPKPHRKPGRSFPARPRAASTKQSFPGANKRPPTPSDTPHTPGHLQVVILSSHPPHTLQGTAVEASTALAPLRPATRASAQLLYTRDQLLYTCDRMAVGPS